jgi:ribosomal protein S18 acetylase RimI-like enzyme
VSITSRQLRDENDYQGVRVMLQRIYAHDGPPDYGTVGDIDWWRFTDADPSAIQRARIWLNEDRDVVGFAWPTDDRLDSFSLPEYRDLEPEMVRWAETQVRISGEHTSMTAFAYDGDHQRQSVLRDLGFEPAGESIRLWHRSLDDVPSPSQIGDYVIRNLAGDEEVEERVAAHRDAFAPSKMTIEKHRAVMTSPTYRRDLDIVAVTPDGTIAAYCIVWLDEVNTHGVFEPVGCRPAHQRRGLTREVLFEGMRRIKALGARRATVASDPTATAANRLYASAGFTYIDTNRDWVKQLT